MIIFFYTMKRILQDRGQLMAMLLLPVGFITLTMMIFAGQFNLTIGIANFDNSPLTEALIESLEIKGRVVFLEGEEVEKQLINGRIQLGLIIPEGFTRDIVDNKNPQIKGYRINETDVTIPVLLYIDNFMAATKHIATVANGDMDIFNQGLKEYLNGSIVTERINYNNPDQAKGLTTSGMGFLLMSMLFFSTTAANTIMEDKEHKTFYRVLSAPVRLKKYMLENILSFLVLSLIQIFTVFAIMKYVFKMNMGPSILNLIIVLFVFSIVAISFAMALTALSKDSKQMSTLVPLLVMPMVMLGGCFWPRFLMPTPLIKLSNFVPTTWALEGVEKVLYGQPISAVTTEILILLLFSGAFFLLATWKKAEITI